MGAYDGKSLRQEMLEHALTHPTPLEFQRWVETVAALEAENARLRGLLESAFGWVEDEHLKHKMRAALGEKGEG